LQRQLRDVDEAEVDLCADASADVEMRATDVNIIPASCVNRVGREPEAQLGDNFEHEVLTVHQSKRNASTNSHRERIGLISFHVARGDSGASSGEAQTGIQTHPVVEPI